MIEYQNLWNDIRDTLEKRLNPSTFENTFGDVKRVVKFENGVIYVLTPSTFVKHTINNAHYDNINTILKSLTTKQIKIKFICENEIKNVKPQEPFKKLSTNNLNLNYNFESFVVGEFNRISYLTALKVAENPGVVFNPLYIFGGVGLGKTHLMQAIGNYVSEKDMNLKILYVQANDYLIDYTKASRDNNMKAFEEKYEDIDLLLIDDIQMLTDKNGTQQQFFKLFNDMTNNKKQIIITSDRPAAKLNGFMDRLTSRFQMGVTVNINQPDLPQRFTILTRKMQELTEKKIDDDVLYYIAENFTSNVRELEGALNRVLLYADLYNTTPNLALAKDALDVLIKNKKPEEKESNYEDVLSVISNMYNISIADILGTSRNAKYVLPRHITMYILKKKYNLSYSKIGSILNGMNHTSVMSGYNKIAAEIEINEELKMAVDAILKKV